MKKNWLMMNGQGGINVPSAVVTSDSSIAYSPQNTFTYFANKGPRPSQERFQITDLLTYRNPKIAKRYKIKIASIVIPVLHVSQEDAYYTGIPCAVTKDWECENTQIHLMNETFGADPNSPLQCFVKFKHQFIDTELSATFRTGITIKVTGFFVRDKDLIIIPDREPNQ